MIREQNWFMLRTSGPKTLPLARSLASAGLDVWTPIEVRNRRRPRSKARVEIEVPVMPTFVFARASQLSQVSQILARPMTGHARFSLFLYDGRIPFIADREVQSLREVEERSRDALKRAQRKNQRRSFPAGTEVRVPEGSFAGMSGIVKQGDDRFALVCFGGSMTVKIATFLLEADAIQCDRPATGTAAQAA
ncbi:transcription termination/antitermination NusG family protein [Sphingomonas sp. 1P06PA]|uniref:hypothetical protein n=1 Tax=Sphingomonas sp. 1P06PA TaxID=554121 RepID=UPI0039A73A14